MPPERDWESSEGADVRQLPGGLSNTTHGEGVVRGVGYAVGIKNVGFSEGFDDYSTARVRMEVIGGEPVATVHTAMAEVGQGGVTVHAQIARTELGVAQVTIHPADTRVGSAGSTSASRQTYVTGGAVKNACERVRERVLEIGRRKFGSYHPAWATAELLLEHGRVFTDGGEILADLADVLDDEVVEAEEEWRHRPTEPFDPHTGQGNGHVQYSFAAHRAVVDVDTELGLVKVVELACAQDVGKALNPLSVIGQIQGGTTQGLGIAVMEEIVVDPRTAKVRNPSFTDYLIPTILDTPPMPVDVLELADEHAPYGLRGVGEAPTLSSTPAVFAAIRDATGLELNRTPVRPTPHRPPPGPAPGYPTLRAGATPERHIAAPRRPDPEYRTPAVPPHRSRGTSGSVGTTAQPFVSGRPPGRAADAPSQIPQLPPWRIPCGCPYEPWESGPHDPAVSGAEDRRGGRGRGPRVPGRTVLARPVLPHNRQRIHASRARCAAASPPSWRWRTSSCSTRSSWAAPDATGHAPRQPA
ncbi:hypothetical protein SGLAM104S_10641 [Streptomyces glaucescens]